MFFTLAFGFGGIWEDMLRYVRKLLRGKRKEKGLFGGIWKYFNMF